MKIYTKDHIKGVLDTPSLIEEIKKGLMHLSEKKVVNSPVGFLQFNEPVGDVHIKAGALIGGDLYVVKVASGFYDNPLKGLPTSNGLMMLFSQKTGQPLALLLDDGYLTDLRTALAGALCAKYLSKASVSKIGIIGAGIQAKIQLECLQLVTPCREVLVWGRHRFKAEAFASDPALAMFHVTVSDTIEQLANQCDLIVTATTSTEPFLYGHQLRPGTHITAIGADSAGKQELDASVFEAADVIVADSLEQCVRYGDLAYASPEKQNSAVELGDFLAKPRERHDDWITVADLTGVAVEDLQIAAAVYHALAG